MKYHLNESNPELKLRTSDWVKISEYSCSFLSLSVSLLFSFSFFFLLPLFPVSFPPFYFLVHFVIKKTTKAKPNPKIRK